MFTIKTLDDFSNSINNYEDYCRNFSIQRIKKCPRCNMFIEPIFLCDATNKDSGCLSLECPSCHKIFMIEYSAQLLIQQGMAIENIFPIAFEEKVFEDEILFLSPDFVKIYNQALEAESYNLDAIAGPGYRKALEFLIKDYIISLNIAKEEIVKNTLLGTCINNWIKNEEIQDMARCASWIGNDETHYDRKWENKDINDLKILIEITTKWIELKIKALNYKKEMLTKTT